jgi:hypothetical protein
VHHRAAGGERQRLVLVVGDHDEGDAEPVLQVGEFKAQLLAQLGIERRERLVEEEDTRPLGDCAGERHALALPAGKLIRHPGLKAVELHLRQGLVHAGTALGGRQAVHAQPIFDVAPDAHVREDRIALEDHVDRPPVRRLAGHVLPVDQDLPARGRLEPGQHAQERGLAAARGAEEREELALLDREAHVVNGQHVAEPLGDVADLDDGAHGPLRPEAALRHGAPAGEAQRR